VNEAPIIARPGPTRKVAPAAEARYLRAGFSGDGPADG
jgi:hypothetical protein